MLKLINVISKFPKVQIANYVSVQSRFMPAIASLNFVGNYNFNLRSFLPNVCQDKDSNSSYYYYILFGVFCFFLYLRKIRPSIPTSSISVTEDVQYDNRTKINDDLTTLNKVEAERNVFSELQTSPRQSPSKQVINTQKSIQECYCSWSYEYRASITMNNSCSCNDVPIYDRNSSVNITHSRYQSSCVTTVDSEFNKRDLVTPTVPTIDTKKVEAPLKFDAFNIHTSPNTIDNPTSTKNTTNATTVSKEENSVFHCKLSYETMVDAQVNKQASASVTKIETSKLDTPLKFDTFTRLSASIASNKSITSAPTLPKEDNRVLTIYTDGSLSYCKSEMTIGIYVDKGHPLNRSEIVNEGQPNPTRAEMIAVIQALTNLMQWNKYTTKSVLILSDSMGVVGRANGTIKSKKLLEESLLLNALLKQCSSMGINVKVQHVRGHSGIEGNVKADQLATRAHTSYKEKISAAKRTYTQMMTNPEEYRKPTLKSRRKLRKEKTAESQL